MLDALFAFIATLTVLVIAFFRYKHSYFKRRNMRYLQPSIPLGNLTNPFKRSGNIANEFQRIYDEMKLRKWSHGGVFIIASPMYVILDLEMLKNVLAKDFQHFVDRGFYQNEKDEPIALHLLAMRGKKWRNLRAKLTPTFTSGKIKQLFQALLDCQESLHNRIEQDHKNDSPVDAKEVLKCFSIDVIGSCAFGLECNTIKDQDSPFKKCGTNFFARSTKRFLKYLIFTNFPSVARALKIREVDKEAADFFSKIVKDTVEFREKNNYVRRDCLQLLIELKNKKPATNEEHDHDGKALTMDEITAQCFLFFLAGFETTSTVLTWTMYELARDQDIQDKVRAEINTVLQKYHGEVTYDGIQELKYTTQVLNESLRKYPPIAFTPRECVKDYKIPGEDYVIEKGLRVFIPIMAIHHDEEYYPDPEKFDPERFNEENSASRKQYTFMPFGEGPRSCLGVRFAYVEAKVGLVSMLTRYKFALNAKTKQPMKVEMVGFAPCAEGGVWLDVEKL